MIECVNCGERLDFYKPVCPTCSEKILPSDNLFNKTTENQDIVNQKKDKQDILNPRTDNQDIVNKTPDNKTPDNQKTDNQKTDNQTPDNKTPDNQKTDNQKTDNQTPDNKTPDNQKTDNQIPENINSNHQIPKNQIPSNQDVHNKTTDPQNPDNQTPNNQDIHNKTTDPQNPDNQTPNNQDIVNKIPDNQPLHNQDNIDNNIGLPDIPDIDDVNDKDIIGIQNEIPVEVLNVSKGENQKQNCFNEDDAMPVKIELNINKHYYTLEHKVIEFNVTNTSSYNLSNLKLRAKTCNDDLNLHESNLNFLFSEDTKKINLSGFRPRFSGEELIKFEISFTEENNNNRICQGEFIIEIKDKKSFQNHQNVHINIQAEKMMGVDASNLVRIGKEESNESTEQKENKILHKWHEIEIIPVKTSMFSSTPRKKVAVQTNKCSNIKYEKAVIKVRLDDCVKSYYISANKKAVFGRNRRSTDFCIVVLPRNSENDRYSSYLSRQHFEIIYKNTYSVINNLGANGTLLNYIRIKDEPKIIRNNDKISIAGYHKFSYRSFLSDNNIDYTGVSSLSFGDTVTNHLAAIRIKREVPKNSNDSYIIIYTEISAGSHKDNAIVIPNTEETAFKIIYDNGFYLLYPDEDTAKPLTNDMEIIKDVNFELL